MFKNKFAQLRDSRLARQASAGAVALLASAGAMAQSATTIDISEVTSTITSGITTVSTLGVAVLSLVVVVKLFRWVKGAM